MKKQKQHTRNGMRTALGLLCTAFLMLQVSSFMSCSSIDCPLNNRVYAKYMLEGDEKPLSTILTVATIRMDGEDTILLNNVANVDSFMLPMSYNAKADTLFFGQYLSESLTVVDTVYVLKDNQPHFESIDCAPSFFHTITGIKHTRYGIDTIIINKANVNYDATTPHLLIRFKTLAY